MARVTVEDCIDKVSNRFDLVLLASHRARMISSGAQITLDRDNDKNPVVALREIAEQTISAGDLNEDLVHSLQKYVEIDEPEPEAVPSIGAAARACPRRRSGGNRSSPTTRNSARLPPQVSRGLACQRRGDAGTRARCRCRGTARVAGPGNLAQARGTREERDCQPRSDICAWSIIFIMVP